MHLASLIRRSSAVIGSISAILGSAALPVGPWGLCNGGKVRLGCPPVLHAGVGRSSQLRGQLGVAWRGVAWPARGPSINYCAV